MRQTVLGIVPNNIMWREGAGVVRAGLGLATPSDLAAHVFYLMLAFAMMRDFIFFTSRDRLYDLDRYIDLLPSLIVG